LGLGYSGSFGRGSKVAGLYALERSPELGRLKFNLSHSADLALIAIAADAEIGVDLEFIREQSDWAEIARCFFSAAEVYHLNTLPSHLHAHAFFSCWTKKEAYVKARGEGLSLDGTRTDAVLARRWSLYTLQPAPGYIGALAVEGRGRRLRHWHWQASAHGIQGVAGSSLAS